jgi:tetratricopeptide (TPR) repeat protein
MLAFHNNNMPLATEYFLRAQSQQPDSLEIAYNTAYLLKRIGRMDEAIVLYEKVLAHNQHHGQANLGIAQAYLAKGRLPEGFAKLEWRFTPPMPSTQEVKHYLDTHPNLHGKIFALRAEWGIGDTLQFMRYAKLLKDRGATVQFAPLHACLMPLLQCYKYFDSIIHPDSGVAICHYDVPLMSLPYLFNTTQETIPHDVPYLEIPQSLVNEWKAKLPHDTTFKIGICWHGNTIHDERKFIPLKKLMEIAHCKNVTIFSLQQKHGLEQIAQLPDATKLHQFDVSFDTEHGAFMDTAAVMKNLNLIITVDTSIAHLAGALGVPTWILLPEVAEWRWQQKRSDTSWYPTMRLFRQQHENNWDSVMDEVVSELNLLVK